jgi:HAD superfamily hydrolase (TIGR01509 family)
MSQIPFSGVRAVLLDLGDTLMGGNVTAGETQPVWEEVYATIINPTNDPAIPTLAALRSAMNEHVSKVMAHTWQHKTEKEQDLLELFQNAFKHAGFANSHDEAFVSAVIAMEHRLLYQRVVRVGSTTYSTLSALREKGYLVGLVSNFCNLTEVMYDSLRIIKLMDYFDKTAISCEVGWRKPSPNIYRTICERLEVAPQECVFVGDRLIEDVRGPKAFGMRTVLTHEFRQEPLIAEIVPDTVITRLDQLLTLL